MSKLDAAALDMLPTMRDARGALTVADFSQAVPFPVVRLFYVHDVPAGIVRGQHGHYRCSQYMICVSGRLRITLADRSRERAFELEPGHGLLIRPGLFASETYLDAGTVLLVLCDRPYEKDDYIHSRDRLPNDAA